jgi:hypothetical protein
VPFDASNWRQPAATRRQPAATRRQPSVTVLPPTITDSGIRLPPISPERGGGGGPQRIHIDITITDRCAPAPRRRTGSLLGWLLVLLLIAALAAHAQPITYEHFSGRNWRAETFRQGTVEDTRVYRQDGQQRHCHSYIPGGAQGVASDRITTCD